MPHKDKEQVWDIFGRFNYLFILLSFVFCWVSHYSRAIRWSYMLEPLGFKTNKWNNYHAVITGYFMNMLLPRAGEVSRAGVLTRYEKIPFEKGFGTIMAERVIDMIIFLSIAVVTVFVQGEKYPAMKLKYDALTTQYKNGSGSAGNYILFVLISLFAIGVATYIFHQRIRKKVNDLVKGFVEGLLTILRLKKRIQFIAHTFLIWIMYFMLYWICFMGLSETSDISIKGHMLGFIAGGLSIIIVPGGIGIYPVFVAAALSFYHNNYALLYGLGWLAWISQTVLIVIAGVISLFLLSRNKTVKNEN